MNPQQKLTQIMERWSNCQRLMQSMVNEFNMIKAIHESIIKEELENERKM